MKTREILSLRRSFRVATALFVGWLALALIVSPAARTQVLAPGTAWVQTLVESSQLVDDCPICDRLPIVRPLRGNFRMRVLTESPIAVTYAIDELRLVAGLADQPPVYRIEGQGTFTLGGEVAVQQDWTLDVTIDNGIVASRVTLTSRNRIPGRHWPMLQVELDQTNGSETQQYSLTLATAPFRELWISSVKGFVAGNWSAPTNQISDGDLVSTAGRVVRRNAELTARLGIMPAVPDLGLKAVDLRAGGEVLFGIDQPAWSEGLAIPLGPGDVLSDRGARIWSNADLLAAFRPATGADAGLSALQRQPNGEIWFATQTDFFSTALGQQIRHGDLLSNQGRVVRAQADLIARFNPSPAGVDHGLRCVHVWPGGETWFATATSFQGAGGETYAAGDLLSDRGYVVFRNAELFQSFAPPAGAVSGLDACFVISDAEVDANALPPRLELPERLAPPASGFGLSWKGGGRVFQLERTEALPGAFELLTPIVPDLTFEDAGAAARPATVYRVRQW